MDNNEIWEDINGYEGLYQVSNLGNIKSFKRYKDGKLLSPKTDKDGYKEVGLRDSFGKRKFFRIHRIVALEFIPNPDECDFVNHKDSNPGNNNVDNIEWCTMSYNNKYRFSDKGNASHKGEKHPGTKLDDDTVIQIYKLGHSGKYTEPEVAKKFNTTRSVVNKIRLGVTWKHITENI